MTNTESPGPFELAKQFVELCGMITETPASPQEEAIEARFNLRMRQFTPGGPNRGLPKEMADAIERRARMLLSHSQGTEPYADHVLETIRNFTGSGMIRMLGSDYIVTMAGIDLEKGNAGMFDSQTVEQAESRELQIVVETGGSAFVPSLQQAHIRKLETWIPVFREKYGKDPFTL